MRQNEQRCEQEIEDIRRGVRAGNITPDTSLLRFSDEALDEQKHSIRIADEKVALAIQAYDLVCGFSSELRYLIQCMYLSDAYAITMIQNSDCFLILGLHFCCSMAVL